MQMLKDAVKTALDFWFWRASRRELHDLVARFGNTSANSVLELTKSYRGQGWYKRLGAYQVESEFKQLMEWARIQAPRVVIEIGTASGATLYGWSTVCSDLLISVDLPGGIHGGGYSDSKTRLFREFAVFRPGLRIETLRKSSQELSTVKECQQILAGRKADILFIDGDHRYAGAKLDFELWSPLVRPGGFVVFHDIVEHTEPRLRDCEVDRLWRELKSIHPRHWEFVESWSQGWGGIGILGL